MGKRIFYADYPTDKAYYKYLENGKNEIIKSFLYLLREAQIKDKETNKEKVCTCPAENFSWNGQGCVCGGK